MANKYLNFVSDEHLLKCVANLHKSYINKKNNVSRKSFYENKIDTIKLTFDSKFNDIEEGDLVETELLRQIDKSINNFIGTFHEEVLGGVAGYENGRSRGYDIRALDDTLFAEIKNKHNTMGSGSQESVFQKLARFADDHKQAKCYCVQIWEKKSFTKKWAGLINGKEYSHSRVFKISGDQFYALLTGQDDAFIQLYKVLPVVIYDHLKTVEKNHDIIEHSAFSEIKEDADLANRNILDQITFENYPYYKGADKL